MLLEAMVGFKDISAIYQQVFLQDILLEDKAMLSV